MKTRQTRRHFISQTAAVGAGFLLPAPLVHQANKDIDLVPPSLVFLFQGDSITDGNRGRTPDPNHIMGHGYAFSVASRMGADFPSSGLIFYNRGVSGNTVLDLQKRWQTDMLDLKPNVLSVLVGINDAAAVVEGRVSAQTTAVFESVYRGLLNDAKNAVPGIIFVLGIPFVYPIGKRKEKWQEWKEQTVERASAVKRLAKEFDAVLVDYPAVFDKAIKKAPADYWIWDGIHPTVPAHELMAREWIKQTARRISFLQHYHY